MKKVIALVIALVLITVVVSALAAVSYTASNSISRSGNQITATGRTTAPATYGQVGAFLQLQQKDPSTGAWSTYTSMYGMIGQNVSSYSTSKTWTVTSGFNYRVKSFHSVANNGEVAEGYKYSSAVYVP